MVQAHTTVSTPAAMAKADVRWLLRLENYGRALATLQRAIATARSRSLSELK